MQSASPTSTSRTLKSPSGFWSGYALLVTLGVSSYLASVTAGELTAQASVLQRTKRTGVLEAKVHGDGGTLVAAATGTFFILSARAADGS